MPTPRVTIDALPEQATPEDGNFLVVQDDDTTKKMSIATLKTLESTALTAHINDTSDVHDASAISTTDSGSGIDSTTVQGQLGQLAGVAGASTTGLAAHLADTDDAHDASAISAAPHSGVSATNVQGQLEELSTALSVRDVMWVGTDAPVDPEVEVWYDPDEPVASLETVPPLPSRSLEEFGTVDLTGVADATATLNAALAWVYTNHGGIITFPVGQILITGQVIVPNTPHLGAGSEAPTQPSMIWRGAGGFSSGQLTTNEVGGTQLICTFDGATYNDAKFVTRGLGQWVIEDITFRDTTALADTPFLYTTNTTLKVDRCAFIGASMGTVVAQDAIVLGGKLKPISNNYDDPDSAFQGYGTVIARSYFDGIRRAVYGRSYCNQVQIRDNLMDKRCGTNLAGGAVIEFDGSLDPLTTNAGDYCTNNVVTGNYMHAIYYVYGVKVIKGTRNFIGFNGFIDAGVAAVAVARFQGVTIAPTDYASNKNMVIGNATQNDVHMSEDTMSAGLNFLVGDSYTEPSVVGRRIKMPLSAELVIDTPVTGVAGWKLTDATTAYLQLSGDANRTWNVGGPVVLSGNSNGSATTSLTIGNASRDHDAVIFLNAPATKSNQIQLRRGGTNSWLLYDAGSSTLFLRDSVNAVMAMTFNPGAGVTGRVDFGGAVRIPGTLEHKGTSAGFYNAAPIAKPTGVAVTAAGIHAALVSLGLIGA